MPRSWEVLTAMGYQSAPEVEAVWSPDGFDGAETPAGSDYHEWHRWLLAEHARAAGVPSAFVATVVRRLEENDLSWTVRAVADAEPFLAALSSQGRPFVICTNWDYDLNPYLHQARLPVSTPALASWEVGARKPHVKIFRQALALLGADDTSGGIVIGDSFDCDVVGALRASLTPIWIGGSKLHPLAVSGLVATADSLTAAMSRLQ